VKSLNKAFCALSDKSLRMKPKSAAAALGVNTQVKTRPKRI